MDTNGEIYQGKWLNNQRNGTGKCFYKNGDVYQGKWVNGKRCGQGRLKSKDGSLYVGSWMDNKQHGSGQLYVRASLSYQCQFLRTQFVTQNIAVIPHFMKNKNTS